MAELTAQQISRDGLDPTYVACDVAGDDFVNAGDEFIHIKNGDGSPHTVTIVTPATVDGLAVADRDVVVPAGEERMIGPFPAGAYNDENAKVTFTYDAITSLTIAILKPGV